MRTRWIVACALLLALGTPASAHRLDEYLQATTISVEKGRIAAQMRLTPGVAVFSRVFANIDTNRDGVLSAAEQKAYAERVLQDLSLTLDGSRLPLHLTAWKFASTSEMKEGRGEIQLDFDAQATGNGHDRRLIFENHHQNPIAVYLVNALVPTDPDIQVTAQLRNYPQSHYEMDYVQAAPVPGRHPSVARRSAAWGWLVTSALLLFAPFAWFWRRGRVRPMGSGKS